MLDIFAFNNKPYTYCDAKYNNSRFNERAIEVPIGLKLLQKYGQDTLEVGAVLPYYSDIEHTVVDLRDGHKMTTRANILTYYPQRKFKAAISISTLEHVGDGFEDTLIAIEYIQTLLEDNAPYIFTIPYGYNALLDKAILSRECKVKRVVQMNKVHFTKHYWKQVSNVSPLAYNGLSKWANSIFVLTNID